MDECSHLGFSHITGVIDQMYLLIHSSARRIDKYENFKKYSSILLQGTVDHTGQFIDAKVQWRRRNHVILSFAAPQSASSWMLVCFVTSNLALHLGLFLYFMI